MGSSIAHFLKSRTALRPPAWTPLKENVTQTLHQTPCKLPGHIVRVYLFPTGTAEMKFRHFLYHIFGILPISVLKMSPRWDTGICRTSVAVDTWKVGWLLPCKTGNYFKCGELLLNTVTLSDNGRKLGQIDGIATRYAAIWEGQFRAITRVPLIHDLGKMLSFRMSYYIKNHLCGSNGRGFKSSTCLNNVQTSALIFFLAYFPMCKVFVSTCASLPLYTSYSLVFMPVCLCIDSTRWYIWQFAWRCSMKKKKIVCW